MNRRKINLVVENCFWILVAFVFLSITLGLAYVSGSGVVGLIKENVSVILKIAGLMFFVPYSLITIAISAGFVYLIAYLVVSTIRVILPRGCCYGIQRFPCKGCKR